MDSLALLALPVAFLLGTIPFGVLLSKAFGLPDPRSYGSGNIGATNVLRSGRKDVAALTMLLDMLKAYFAVALVGMMSEALVPFALMLPVLGHVYSPWLNFKGGKGVATAFGALFAVSAAAGFLCAVLWLLTFYTLRFSSLAALVAFCFAPIMLWASDGMLMGTMGVLLSTLIFYTHRANINRLMRGNEPAFEFSKKDATTDDAAGSPDA